MVVLPVRIAAYTRLRLDELAEQLGITRTALARQAIELVVRELCRNPTDDRLRTFAERQGKTGDELADEILTPAVAHLEKAQVAAAKAAAEILQQAELELGLQCQSR